MTQAQRRPGTALQKLVQLLDLEALQPDIYRGQTEKTGWKRVYGGLVLAQSLKAAICTVPEDRPVHSLNAYFMLGGDPKVPIDYHVERTRDGGSFTTRRVVARQHDRSIYAMTASFQKQETGLDHQAAMPKVPGPDAGLSEDDHVKLLSQHLPASMINYITRERPIEMRLVDTRRYQSRDKLEPITQIWFRARGTLDPSPVLDACLLAYASDMTLLDTALMAHGKRFYDDEVQMASLDHALWFHRPWRAQDWMLYAQDSPSAQGSRGFSRGSIYGADGTLVASVAQEGLIRLRTSNKSTT